MYDSHPVMTLHLNLPIMDVLFSTLILYSIVFHAFFHRRINILLLEAIKMEGLYDKGILSPPIVPPNKLLNFHRFLTGTSNFIIGRIFYFSSSN